MRDSGAVQSSKGLDNHRQHRALLHLVRIPAWKKKITALYNLLKVLCIDEDWQLLECLLHCILLLDKGVEGLMGVKSTSLWSWMVAVHGCFTQNFCAFGHPCKYQRADPAVYLARLEGHSARE